MLDKSLITSLCGGVRTIKINRPNKKNAMDKSVYLGITEILNADALDNNVVITIITGTGDYFSSGNDIVSALQEDSSSESKLQRVKNMVDAFINYPKIIIAVVNGPAIGIGATMPVLCDIIYVSERAVFDAPFLKLGLLVEGCSSFTFPFTIGRSKASEVLYLNHKLTADEAYQFGLVSRVIPHNKVDELIESLHTYGSIPVKSIIRNKKVVMENFRQFLRKSNVSEIKMLEECLLSEEFSNAVTEFLSRKSKL